MIAWQMSVSVWSWMDIAEIHKAEILCLFCFALIGVCMGLGPDAWRRG